MLKIIIILSFVLLCNSDDNVNNKTLFETNIKFLINIISDKLEPILAKLENDDRISDDCLKSIHYTIDEGLNMKWWAIKRNYNT